MNDVQKKKLFFNLFEKVLERSCYNNPYDLLLAIMENLIDCKDCPLRDIPCATPYKAKTCVGTIEEAIDKGDI